MSGNYKVDFAVDLETKRWGGNQGKNMKITHLMYTVEGIYFLWPRVFEPIRYSYFAKINFKFFTPD